MNFEHLLKLIDNQPLPNVTFGVILFISLIVLAPFIWDSFKKIICKGRRSA